MQLKSLDQPRSDFSTLRDNEDWISAIERWVNSDGEPYTKICGTRQSGREPLHLKKQHYASLAPE